MGKIIIIGGGWAGCAAAITATKAGAEVVLIEKTDLLLGLGNVGGIMRNNGRFTATEENIAMGAWELFNITDMTATHANVNFPGHRHATLYDVNLVEPKVRRLLEGMGVEIHDCSRAVDVVMSDWEHEAKELVNLEATQKQERRIEQIILADGTVIKGDVFVETTGSTGPMGNCLTHGNGCSICVLRCPAFGPRVSISEKAGSMDVMGMRDDGAPGAFSGSGKLHIKSLSVKIQEGLQENGVVVVPIPKEAVKREKLAMKVCQQYALDEYAENIVLLDTGHAKLMTPFFELKALRQIPGFENARYLDPYAGSKGNSIRYLSVANRNDCLKVDKVANLFCGGEKAGLFVGHTEAISTGSLAGHNAARYIDGMNQLTLPIGTAIGDIISQASIGMKTEEGLKKRFTFAGDHYFQRMIERGLYTTDVKSIRERIARYNLTGIYDERLI